MFFDGMAYPTTAEIFDSSENYRVRYPEGFRLDDSLPSGFTDDSAALFWHSVHNAGWSPRQITDWMRNRRLHELGKYGILMDGREAMASDPQMCELFHRFGRLLARKNIRYADGQVIKLSDSSPWGLLWLDSRWGLLKPVILKIGEELDLLKTGFRDLESWTVQSINVPFDRGQVLDVSLRWRDAPATGTAGTSVYGSPWPKAEELEVSYRLAGTADLTRVERGETLRIVTPPKVASGSLGVYYEFFVTGTGGYYEAALEMIVKRVE